MRKKATWIELEVTAATYTWREAFKYPVILLRPIGVCMIIGVIVLNMAPPPLAYGKCSCMFFNTMMGGGIYTWFVNYRSPKHSIPLFLTIFFLCTLSSNTADNKTNIPVKGSSKVNSSSLIWNILGSTFLPLTLGFFGGPVFLKLGKMEAEESKEKK